MDESGRPGIDEDDVALIDALHVNPRAGFEQLGPALGMSAVTAGRRWRRLTRAGLAWISSAPGPAMPLASAVVEVACAPGDAAGIARALAARPQVFSVHLTAGSHDLYALVLARDTAAMSRLLVDDIGRIPAIRQLTARVATHVFSGVHWRLGAIDPEAVEALSSADSPSHATTRELDAFDQALFLALQSDGRTTIRDLSRGLDRSERAVTRRLESLVRAGVLAFRTDFVRSEGGWPAQVALSLRVPDEALHEVGSRVGAWPQTRVCAAVIGAANLFVTVQLHDLPALDPLLRRIRSTWPAVEVTDRQVVLRPVKSWGRLLDTEGRAIDTVPVDPWA
ncbi:Lrp/AsnC family transcriptional regulator [Streptomyces sp. NBC_00988]|uniref:Lrp/AsnC family transcriptional regulator n=1 Tax=Streptomyces sp. NBC_00988 TaxID=2903704 RepID=UPI0038659EDF|nr:Lrp/AsnC family transcriptional regulator [Streptomyces sp. NBC_00988]